MTKRRPLKGRSQINRIWWVAGIAIVAAAGLIALNLIGATGTDTAAKTDADLGALRNVWGKDVAPVTLVEFGDYQ